MLIEPPPGQVGAEPAYRLVDIPSGKPGDPGDLGSDRGVKVGLWAPPPGMAEAIGALERHRDHLNRAPSEQVSDRVGQWWTVNNAKPASNARSWNGRWSATARMADAASAGRWVIIAADGSTATTTRSAGS